MLSASPHLLAFAGNGFIVRLTNSLPVFFPPRVRALTAVLPSSFELSPLPRAGQSAGQAVGKDPVNSLSVEGFVQKTVVASPEVAHFSLFSLP